MAQANRRDFLKTTAATGIGYWVAGGVQAEESKSPNEKIGMASVGIGGKGGGDSSNAARAGQLVAMCDVDTNRLEGATRKPGFKDAEKFTDFREMLDKMGDKIDAVTVSTPDHTHAPAALMAMRMGKHCFCQKPLTHTIYEARLMGQVAKEKGLATQMGNQGTAGSGLRKAAAMLKKGVLGTVKEVHVWTNRPVWPQGIDRGTPKPVPEHLEWDLWLSVAPDRPYADNYHDFKWRGWWDFGTGALGDMACHTVNMPFMGLDLANPTSVKAITAGHNKDSYPAWSLIDFKFPANDNRPEIAFKWYDGGKKPDVSILDGLRDKMPGSGCVIVGEKGKMFSPDDYGSQYFLTEGVEEPDVEYPRSPGHFQEWVAAIKGGPEAMSNFADYAGPLTETILLGNLAVWCAAEKNDGDQAVGEEVLWDAKTMTVKNIEGLESIVKPTYRDGYILDV